MLFNYFSYIPGIELQFGIIITNRVDSELTLIFLRRKIKRLSKSRSQALYHIRKNDFWATIPIMEKKISYIVKYKEKGVLGLRLNKTVRNWEARSDIYNSNEY